ncbi:polysaccharide biosynthesis/export family protein [uncultured Azohydromonas sp.]|jgi:Periplasmic protein involved in polysaccharide export|uniref:polysaccharide biosynthesis/export family protein n=1 Tax=uncultured Azohydromonas sp. TaxID=487342 RepID=UPI0026346A9C|nr:polysaccharide biosynthesis/export family protein [uncultured Azohydromonas sp.]
MKHRSFLLRSVAPALALALGLPAHAQTATQRQDPATPSSLFSTGAVRGATELAPLRGTSAATAAPGTAAPATGLAVQAAPGAPAATVSAPLPPNPATAAQPVVFGSQIFSGRFAAEGFSGFNSDYQLAVGDRVNVRLWGAFTFDGVQPVDAQGNIFVPNVGAVKVAGVRNGDLNAQVEAQVKRVFRANVGVYATLEAAQPVKVYVTGFVRAPGLYGGLSSDSVLSYLDRAGGIDPDRGSYLSVQVLRAGRPRAQFNLYDFLLNGHIAPLQLQQGDTVVVGPRRHSVQVGGEAFNPYVFEFDTPALPASQLLAMARPTPNATHLSIVRKIGTERRSEYFPLSAADQVQLQDGDEVTFTADKYPGTILVRVEGANLGERTLVLPYGSRLKDAMARLQPAPQANLAALQLYRKSVAVRQKEMLDTSLRSLETYALTARSATSEEAALRTREAELLLQFIERAKNVQPKGQVVLANAATAQATLLEDGDVLRLPEQSNLVLVSGEVLFPNALVHDPRAAAEDYVNRVGGYTQNADASKLVVLHQDGSVGDATRESLQPGDEIMVLPRIDTKKVEITRGITQIIYQIAVAAKVVFGL